MNKQRQPACRRRGQATLEFIVTLPLLILIIYSGLQLMKIGQKGVRVESATWYAIRARTLDVRTKNIPESTVISDIKTELFNDDDNINVSFDTTVSWLTLFSVFGMGTTAMKTLSVTVTCTSPTFAPGSKFIVGGNGKNFTVSGKSQMSGNAYTMTR